MPTTTASTDPVPYVRAIALRGRVHMSLSWSVSVSTNPRRTRIRAEWDAAKERIVFTIPAGTDPHEAAASVRKLAPRLPQFVANARATMPNLVGKELVSGEGFELLGTHYRLWVVDDADQPITDGPGPSTWSGVRTWAINLRRDHAIPRTVIEWYRAKGQAFMDEQIPAMAERLGVAPGLRWTVRPFTPKMSASWERYTPNSHTITVDWMVFQMPRQVARAVLAHGVAHAARPGGQPHGPAWQRLYERLCPDWRELDQAAKNCTGMTLWTGAATLPPAPVEVWRAVRRDATTTCGACGTTTSYGGNRVTNGTVTLCGQCNRNRLDGIWDARPAGVYGVRAGDAVGYVRHDPPAPHPYADEPGRPRGAERCQDCGRHESSPIHTSSPAPAAATVVTIPVHMGPAPGTADNGIPAGTPLTAWTTPAGPPLNPDAVQAAARDVVRTFQRFTAQQRADRAAAHTLGPRQRTAVGEFVYSHPANPGVSFRTRKLAAAAAAAVVESSAAGWGEVL